MRRPPGCWLLWWCVAAAAAAAAAADPVVGSASLAAQPRFKGRASEGRIGRTHTTIVSGKLAKSRAFPYQVYLRVFLRNGSVDFCGGAIVGVRHILSAAHCVDKRNIVKTMAVIGTANRFSPRAFRYNITHQTFYITKPGEDVDADIVLLMVDRPMPLGKINVKAVRLQTYRSFNSNILCSVAGWGDSRDNLDPNILKFVRVPLVSRARCERAYPFDPPDDLLCAGYYERGGADTCQGDSGGPLVCGGRLTGIVKGGTGCGLPHFPGTYTDVRYYWRWVRTVMTEDWEEHFRNSSFSPFRRRRRRKYPPRFPRKLQPIKTNQL